MYQLADKVFAISHEIEGDKVVVSIVSGTIAEIQEYTIHNKHGKTSQRRYLIEWFDGQDYASGQFLEKDIFQVANQVFENIFDILNESQKSKAKLKTQ